MIATTSPAKKMTVTRSTCTTWGSSAALGRARHAQARRRHRLESILGDVLPAGLAPSVGSVFELAERRVDLEQGLAQRPDQGVDLAPFRRHLTRVGKALVVRVAVDAELAQLAVDSLAFGRQLGAPARVGGLGHAGILLPSLPA